MHLTFEDVDPLLHAGAQGGGGKLGEEGAQGAGRGRNEGRQKGDGVGRRAVVKACGQEGSVGGSGGQGSAAAGKEKIMSG